MLRGPRALPNAEAAPAPDVGAAERPLPPGTHVFAHCGGPRLRVAPPLGSGTTFGAGECWHHLVGLPLPRPGDQRGARALDARAAELRVAGGQVDVDEDGVLRRWCCYTHAGRRPKSLSLGDSLGEATPVWADSCGVR